MQTLDQIIPSHPFWKELNLHCFHILKECAAFVKFDIDQPIFDIGGDADRFYLIYTGRVALKTLVPGKGPITIETLGAGEALGWSWLFPPYRWPFSARSVEPTEAVAFGAHDLRNYAEENHDFGYELITRVGQVIFKRLQATRRQLVEFYVLPRD